MGNDLPVELSDLSIDPFELSKKWLVVAMFFQSTSKNYKEAVSIAGGASYFKQLNIDGQIVNIAGFDKTQRDVSIFIVLQEIINGWKGSRFFAGGRVISNFYRVIETLNCFLLSLACRKYEAFCWEIMNHPFYKSDWYPGIAMTISVDLSGEQEGKKEDVQPDPLLLKPCKRLDLRRLSKHHPSDIVDQIQALAVEENVDWCPNFKPEDAKKIER